ncbi:MAG: MMPL family transporter [Actinomycetota bacterium]|nr:MMPL family transporter [Actinomycetota bacterium]
MDAIASWALRRRKTILAAWLVLLTVGGVLATGLNDKIVPGGEAPASSQSQKVARALERSSLPSLFVVVRWDERRVRAERVRSLDELAAALRRVPGVTRVTRFTRPSDARRRASTAGVPLSALNVTTRGSTDGAKHVASKLIEERKRLAPKGATLYVGGFGAYGHELTTLAQSDLARAERVGLPIVFAVLLLTFASVWAALIPLAIALSSLVIGLGVLSVVAGAVDISEYVENSASMIGIALGVDYAMFLVQRAREGVRSGQVPDAAIRMAMRTTGVAVLWSGGTVLVAEATLLLPDTRATRSAALGMMLVTIFAVASAVVVAPVIMSLLQRRLFRPGARGGSASGSGRKWWERWAHRVTRRPLAWLAASTLAMVALAVPVLDLDRSVDFSTASTLPEGSSVRQAYTLASGEFGPGAMSPLQVVLRQPAQGRAEGRSAVRRFVEVVRRDPRVEAVRAAPSLALPGSSERAVPITVVPRHGSFDDRTRGLVRSLREGPLHRELAGLAYDVGGEDAVTMDMKSAMFDSLPLVLAVLLSMVAAVLLFAFRSVFLPLKAGLLVVLSLGASLGGLLLLTQTEAGAWLIGAGQPTEINPFVPITIVAIVIALSTDYEVILIGRIAEHFRQSGDNSRSVIRGVAQTGGVITSAAAIMIAVFLGFALADLPTLKHLGVGLALAVLLDATIVRAILVPATMQVMGRWNWWLPRPSPRTPKPGGAAPESTA